MVCMKTVVKFCWGWAILSAVCALLSSYLGVYGLLPLVAAGAGYYVIRQADKRVKRLNENADVIDKMSAKQRDAFEKLDRKELKDIESLFKLILVISVAVALFLIYVWFYNMQNNISMALFSWDFLNKLAPLGVILSVLFMLIYTYAFYVKARELINHD